MDIHVSSEELITLSQNLDGVAGEMDDLIKRLNTLIQTDLPTYMTGLTSQSYVDQYDERLQPALIEGMNFLSDTAEQLRQIVQGFNDADSGMSNQVSGI